MTQLYISIALSLGQKGDEPGAAKQTRIRCKANIEQTQQYIGHEPPSESIYEIYNNMTSSLD